LERAQSGIRGQVRRLGSLQMKLRSIRSKNAI